jgi:hypothetical protein
VLGQRGKGWPRQGEQPQRRAAGMSPQAAWSWPSCAGALTIPRPGGKHRLRRIGALLREVPGPPSSFSATLPRYPKHGTGPRGLGVDPDNSTPRVRVIAISVTRYRAED